MRALGLAVLASCAVPVTGTETQADMGSGGPTCDQQVDALLGGNSNGFPAIGYASSNFAAVVDPILGNALFTPNVLGAAWPGATIAITRNGKLIFARAYGYGIPESGVYMEPDSLMRIMSISKSITAMATLKMIHDAVPTPGGSPLTLTSTPFTFLSITPTGTGPYSTTTGDTSGYSTGTYADAWSGNGGYNTQLDSINVRELLYHTGGWDRDAPYYADDPFFPPMDMPGGKVATALGLTTSVPSCKQTLRYVMTQPLQFKPGTDLHYSNIGYCVLGEMIAELAGTSYAKYVTTNILTPFGMNETFPGATQNQLDREVGYYSFTCAKWNSARTACVDQTPKPTYVPTPSSASIIPGETAQLTPYGGGVYIESYTGFGNWVSSAIDLARFGSAIQDLTSPMQTMFVAPPSGWPDNFYTWTDRESGPQQTQGVTDWWNGLGWDQVDPGRGGGRDDLVKDGGNWGTSTETWLTSTANGDYYTLTVLFDADWPGTWLPDSLLNSIGYGLLTTSNLPANSVDFFPMYSQPYTAWQDPTTFASTLSTGEAAGQYPARIDGRNVIVGYTDPHCTPAQLSAGTCPNPSPIYQPQYRARLAAAPAEFGATTYVVDQTCDQMIAALSGPSAIPGEVVSLQKFLDETSTWRYQAVFSPIPPAHL